LKAAPDRNVAGGKCQSGNVENKNAYATTPVEIAGNNYNFHIQRYVDASLRKKKLI
jgi:hypothetical protein